MCRCRWWHANIFNSTISLVFQEMEIFLNKKMSITWFYFIIGDGSNVEALFAGSNRRGRLFKHNKRMNSVKIHWTFTQRLMTSWKNKIYDECAEIYTANIKINELGHVLFFWGAIITDKNVLLNRENLQNNKSCRKNLYCNHVMDKEINHAYIILQFHHILSIKQETTFEYSK